MKTHDTTFFIGRLNVIYSRTDDKKTFIANSVRKGIHLSMYNFGWGFFEVELIDVEERTFIIGYLVKYELEGQGEIVDKYEGKLKPIDLSDFAKAKSKFILDIESGLIAYNPVPQHIRENTFRTAFASLLEKANNGFLVSAEIQLITEAHDFLAKLRLLKRINRIRITLYPSNPNTKPIWAGLDKLLKDMNASQLRIEYTSDEMNIPEGSRADSEIRMAVDGYGKAQITGYVEQKETTISTENTPVKVKDTFEGDTKKIENKVLAKLLSLIRGTEENEL